MNNPPKPSHLIERAAEKLSAASDLSLSAPPPRRPADSIAESATPGGLNRATVAEDAAMRSPEADANEAKVGGKSDGTGDLAPAIVDLAALSAAGLVVVGNLRTRISEEYRIAVSRILREARSRRPGPPMGELLMVTSARPGEGKSFTAINLAGAIAHNVMRPTVLVDVDFKKKSITYQLGLSNRLGLLDVAATSKLQIEDLIVPTEVENLSILPVGRDAGEVRDGIARRPISQVIERMARLFPDHIFILDLPPCLSTSDPSTLAPVVNEVIMVVEAERTQRNEVEAAIDLIKLCPKITLLLNKIQATTKNTFGAYDYYGSYS